jgi:holliday junction DNA helicase RuvA
MISYLKGQPLIHNQTLTILVGGIGYGVKANNNTLSNISAKPEVELFIYTHVKEEKLELYGFETFQQKEMFELVLSVSGVGPSTALNLIAPGTHQLISAVQNAQVPFFTAIPRVGKKLAQKIIIELRGKLGELKALDLGPKSQNYQEVFEALISLGFDEQNISLVLEEMDLEEMDIAKAIKLAMKKLKK